MGRWRGLREKAGSRPVILAVFAVFALVLSGGAMLLEAHGQTGDHWAAINLNFGASPISQSLVVQFARVGWIDQPTQWSSTGFTGATVTTNSSYQSNSSGYGILQYNSTVGDNALASYPIAGSLGSNVSYLFANQRTALNGTETIWTWGIFQAAQTTAPPASGNVSNSAAGAQQNAIWIVATHATGGNYTLKVGDWEEQHGGFQTLTLTTIAAANHMVPLKFSNIYIYVQKTQAVVSLVYTNNGTVQVSATVHPVLSGNLSKAAYLADDVFMATTGTNSAMIVANTYLVDHNVYTTAPAAQGAFEPLVVGTDSNVPSATPFDPSVTNVANYSEGATGTSTFSGVNVSTSAFGAIVNSNTTASRDSSMLNQNLILNRSTTQTTAFANATLSTLRSEPESLNKLQTATLVLTSWTPQSVGTQIQSFLTNYVSGQSGVPTADVVITGYIVQSISVTSTFSSQAAQTIQDYVDSAIPGFMASSNLALVNPSTGAVDAGADLGMFLADGKAYAPVVVNQQLGVFEDPINGKTYDSPQAAGFPSGSFLTAAGSISVPGQAAFLGWNATGVPEFSSLGCFVVCLPSLTGAASAVSDFLGGAASSVSNAVGTVTSAVGTGVNDVVEPAASTTTSLGADVSSLTSDVSGAVANAMPFFGGTLANVGSDISGAITNSLSSASGTLASAASGAAGALSAGVGSVSNALSTIGTPISLNGVGSEISGAANSIVNTMGNVVSDASGVLSPLYASISNIPSTIEHAGSVVTQSLASLGSGVASAGISALDSVGSTISQGLSGAWSDVTNGFGQLAGDIFSPQTGFQSTSTTPMNWLSAFGQTGSLVWEIVIIVVVAIVLLLVVVVLWHRHKKRKHGSSGGKTREAKAAGSSKAV